MEGTTTRKQETNMSRKTADAPRRLYVRNGFTHVLFVGKLYGTKGETKLSLDRPVTIEQVPSNGGRARVKVTQAQRGSPARGSFRPGGGLPVWSTVSKDEVWNQG